MIVYIAGPYSQPDPVLNVIAAVKAAEEVRALGHLPFVPHLSHLWHLISPHEYAYWIEMGLEWLDVCDCIIRLPGESPGADGEVARMIEQHKPVFYSVQEFAAKNFAAYSPQGAIEAGQVHIMRIGGM